MNCSSAGLLTVKRGTCVPITPYVRQNWRVTRDEARYRDIYGSEHMAAGEPAQETAY